MKTSVDNSHLCCGPKLLVLLVFTDFMCLDPSYSETIAGFCVQ